jgi:hypothetical protein
MLCEEYIKYNPDNPDEYSLEKQVVFEILDEVTNNDELSNVWMELDDMAQEQVLMSILKKVKKYS